MQFEKHFYYLLLTILITITLNIDECACNRYYTSRKLFYFIIYEMYTISH